MKAKAGGLNTIDTVIPWNLHEPEPGVFNFAGEADLPAYLDLIHELGMYAVVRPGPYICAEWENGGFPVWLTARSAAQNLKLRTDDPIFLAAVQRWFDRLLPIFVDGRSIAAARSFCARSKTSIGPAECTAMTHIKPHWLRCSIMRDSPCRSTRAWAARWLSRIS